MFTGEIFSDFVVLWLTAHATRFQEREAGKPETCWLEEWTKVAAKDGTRILGDLRQGVENALQTFGQGFVGHPQNRELRDSYCVVGRSRSRTSTPSYCASCIGSSSFSLPKIASSKARRSCIRATIPQEAREARTRFAKYYGTKRFGAWRRTFEAAGTAICGNSSIYSSALFPATSYLSCAACSSRCRRSAVSSGLRRTRRFSTTCELTNADFLEAIRHLAFTRQDRSLRPVDYRNLGAEELGGVYESLLALTPQIGSDGTSFSFAELAGNERKTSGSYYTPDSLVQCLLDSALDPVVEDGNQGRRPGPMPRRRSSPSRSAIPPSVPATFSSAPRIDWPDIWRAFVPWLRARANRRRFCISTPSET